MVTRPSYVPGVLTSTGLENPRTGQAVGFQTPPSNIPLTSAYMLTMYKVFKFIC